MEGGRWNRGLRQRKGDVEESGRPRVDDDYDDVDDNVEVEER